ncbi:hypothetical protein B2G50_15000 [Leptospira interrogans serovar Canicola]|nr:hypothetical protein B2G47_12455 [Leptospira interrogans serovar Canicola]ASV09598.1 hypothetical protein B2G50_15000 [Leptospira interrogans serovar Canicola]
MGKVMLERCLLSYFEYLLERHSGNSSKDRHLRFKFHKMWELLRKFNNIRTARKFTNDQMQPNL